MNTIDPDKEQEKILNILGENPELQLREIHQRLVDLDDSSFEHSPEPGNTWNDERHILRALRDILRNKRGAITNEQGNNSQKWSLSKEGERLIESSTPP